MPAEENSEGLEASVFAVTVDQNHVLLNKFPWEPTGLFPETIHD